MKRGYSSIPPSFLQLPPVPPHLCRHVVVRQGEFHDATRVILVDEAPHVDVLSGGYWRRIYEAGARGDWVGVGGSERD